LKVEIPARNGAKAILLCALLAVLVAVVFGQTLRHDFVHYDDYPDVVTNPHVTGGFSLHAAVRAFTYKEWGLWVPLVTISHMLDWQLYGRGAGGHHLTNLLLHLASTILLFVILRRMTGALWRSAFVAAVFAIHPLHVESVAWIAERKDVLSGFFFMLTLGGYLFYIERPASAARYLCVFFLFALGLMSKPMLVTVPFVLLLLDYWPLKRLFEPSSASPSGEKRSRFSLNTRALADKIPLLALSAAACAATMLGNKAPLWIDMEPVPFATRMAEAPASFVIYLGQMFWPAGLSVIYTHFEETAPWAPVALALLAAISAGAFLARKRLPYLWMGWLWNLVMLVPVSGIVQISRHTRADHYNYLPQIGLYIGLTWAVADWAQAWPRRRVVLGSAAAVILTALLVAAFRQTAYWRDDFTLWPHTLACTRDNYVADYCLGDALVAQGRTEEGVAHLREAVRLVPSYADVHESLGIALDKQAPTDEGIAQLREALRLDPNLLDAHNALGVALFRRGQTEQGIAQMREALRIKPDFAEGHCNLGNALLQTGQTKEGLAELREAVRLDPALERAHYILGKALLAQGQTAEAISELSEAGKLDPSDARDHNTLGIALFQQGRADEGIAEFRQALALNPADAQSHNNLAKALLEEGQTAEAISEAEKALELQPASAAFQNNLAWMLATAPQTSLRDGARAVRLASAASQSSGGMDPGILRTLAAAYAQAGKYSEAIRTAQAALPLAASGALAGPLRRDINLYQTGHPLPDGQ
jgi:Flp pilus assembly protein TadD